MLTGQATSYGSAIAGTYQAVSLNGLGNQLVPHGNPYMQNYRATRRGTRPAVNNVKPNNWYFVYD